MQQSTTKNDIEFLDKKLWEIFVSNKSGFGLEKKTFLSLQEVENKLFLNLKLAWKTHFGILFKVKRTKIPNLQ